MSGQNLFHGRLGAVIALLLLVTGLPAAAQQDPSGAADDDPVLVAMTFDFNALDPHRAFCDACRTYLAATYETLLTLDAGNNPVPLLAESWQANEAQTVFTFRLDPAARFSDGSPVEARDVRWSLERLRNLAAAPTFLAADIAAIDTPDDRTVVIRLSRPNGQFPLLLAAPYAAIVNSDVASANGARADADAPRQDKAAAWFVSNSAGSGPFVLQSYRTGEELTLARNPAYWREPPHLETVTLVHAADSEAKAGLLASGDADTAIGIDAPAIRKLVQSKKFTIEQQPADHFIYLALSPGAKQGGEKLTPAVREAIDLALDREALIARLLPGAASLISAPISPLVPGGSGYVARPHDPARARELLARAGHVDGLTLEAAFPALMAFGVDFADLMKEVQQQLAAVGVTLTLRPLPYTQWRETINGEGIPVTAVFYAPDYVGTEQYAEYFGLLEGSPWMQRAAMKAPEGLNRREGQLMKQALSEPLDRAATTWHRLGLELVGDRIILPLMSPDIILVSNRKVAGLRHTSCCGVPLAGLRRP